MKGYSAYSAYSAYGVGREPTLPRGWPGGSLPKWVKGYSAYGVGDGGHTIMMDL